MNTNYQQVSKLFQKIKNLDFHTLTNTTYLNQFAKNTKS